MAECKICGKSFKRGLYGHVRFGHGRDWEKYKAGEYEDNDEEETETETEKEKPAKKGRLRTDPDKSEFIKLRRAPDTDNDGSKDARMLPAFEQELWVKATPLVRKVALNPEMYFWYDYARGSLDFEGDMGDFVADCVRDFFKSRGYKIQIVQEEDFG